MICSSWTVTSLVAKVKSLVKPLVDKFGLRGEGLKRLIRLHWNIGLIAEGCFEKPVKDVLVRDGSSLRFSDSFWLLSGPVFASSSNYVICIN